MSLKITIIAGATLLLAACNPTAEVKPNATKTAPAIKLYTMSCGKIDISNIAAFSNKGAFDGQSRVFSSSCYLIRHPDGDMMWDAGLPDALAQNPDGMQNGVFHVSVPKTLKSQLDEIGVAPDDIEYFAMSHSHFDHTGNANMFAGAPKWIVDANEHAWMFEEAPAAGIAQLDSFIQFKDKPAIKITSDHDVFGDGSVTIIQTPGHTPGHLALLVKLPKTGNLLLSGDLYHMPESREFRRIPVFNTSPEQTLASMDKFEALAKAENARVIIQHFQQDVDSLPAFPAYAE
ncbi:MAG: N-acyl homoserine lactonase family protein [Robiginitomaculum sp.]|nr:N-acyl homoserine lactonase family protein [Robiginitomaculum sp.]